MIEIATDVLLAASPEEFRKTLLIGTALAIATGLCLCLGISLLFDGCLDWLWLSGWRKCWRRIVVGLLLLNAAALFSFWLFTFTSTHI